MWYCGTSFGNAYHLVINGDEEISSKYTSLMAPLEVEIEDSYLECVEGDEVTIYYDGNITDGEPTLVDKAYLTYQVCRHPLTRMGQKHSS